MTDTLDPTETTEPQHSDAAHNDHHGPTDKQFIQVFVALAAITALEVALSYADVGVIFLPALLILMVVKFFTVVLVFMHVKYDNPLFGRLFYIGLVLALAVYIATLACFQFFAG